MPPANGNAQRLVREAYTRKARAEKIVFEDLCFTGQREFVSDPAKYILACCSRRAGKSFGIAIKMLKTGFDFPKSQMVYAAMARSQGKEILWPALEQLNDEHNLSLSFKRNSGDVVFPNGSTILMRGLGSQREAEKLRGLRLRAGCVDEAQGFPAWFLDYVIREIIAPATLEYGDDCWIALTGTPSPMCRGGFYNAWNGLSSEGKPVRTFSTHHWTFFDNEFIPNPEKRAEEVREANGWTTETPSYLREYLGRWVKDTEGAAFRIDGDRNVVDRFPEEAASDWRYVLGIDLGIDDPCAYVVSAYSRQLGECYILESFEEEVESVSQSASHVFRLQEKYDFSEMIADTGGQGKAHVAEWAQTYGLAVTAAQKHNKGGRVQMINADLLSAKLKIVAPQNQQLLDELAILQWDRDALDRGKYVWARNYKDHLADAAQYGFGGCHHHHHRLQKEAVRTEEAFYRQQEDAMEAAQIRSVRERRNPSALRNRYYQGLWG